MKEATGELNMTVVTLIAVAAVAALFYFFLWPMVQKMVAQQTCNTYGTDYVATPTTTEVETGSQAKVRVWMCCPKKGENVETDTKKCITIDANTSGGGGTSS